MGLIFIFNELIAPQTTGLRRVTPHGQAHRSVAPLSTRNSDFRTRVGRPEEHTHQLSKGANVTPEVPYLRANESLRLKLLHSHNLSSFGGLNGSQD